MAGMTPEQRRERSLRDEVSSLLREFIPSSNLPRAIEQAVESQAKRIIELVRDHDKEED